MSDTGDIFAKMLSDMTKRDPEQCVDALDVRCRACGAPLTYSTPNGWGGYVMRVDTEPHRCIFTEPPVTLTGRYDARVEDQKERP